MMFVFCKNVNKLRFTRDPMELMMCFTGWFAIFGNLYSCSIIKNEDGWNAWKALSKFTPLFGAKVCHIV